jgi:hypothetical protein
MKIKNWKKFQHFKDRRPPWIKLYRELLDDLDWHSLDADASKVLVMLWLIASEDDGNLPELKKLAFRLRMTEKALKPVLASLSHWLDQDDIKMISRGYQEDAPETETETETKRNEPVEDFYLFWSAYPKKVAKANAMSAFKKAKINGSIDLLLSELEKQKRSDQWKKDNGQFIPNPATWINQRRWEDETSSNDIFNGDLAYVMRKPD